MNKKRSTNIEIQQFFSLQITLQTLSDTNRTYTGRRTRKQEISDFKRHKTADISDYIIYLEKHICRTTALHFLTVDQQMKVKILNILIVLHRNKSSNSSRRIKTFAKLPGITLLTELSLKVNVPPAPATFEFTGEAE